MCEGTKDAVEQASPGEDAGAQALDIMPPHHWLGSAFGRATVLDYFEAVGKASGLPLIVHVYPARTKATILLRAACGARATAGQVHAFKIGTREMNKYQRDLEAIRAAAPNKALLTLHDEYLLASMVQGIDGALVGFVRHRDLIHDLVQAVKAGDLKRAMAIQARIDPLKAVYGGGEPTGEAHANMKAAMVAAGSSKAVPCGRRRSPRSQGAGADRGSRR